MVPRELDKVLSIKFYAEVTKRNGNDNELESLKIMQSAIERVFKREKLSTGHRALGRVSPLKRKSITELH